MPGPRVPTVRTSIRSVELADKVISTKPTQSGAKPLPTLVAADEGADVGNGRSQQRLPVVRQKTLPIITTSWRWYKTERSTAFHANLWEVEPMVSLLHFVCITGVDWPRSAVYVLIGISAGLVYVSVLLPLRPNW